MNKCLGCYTLIFSIMFVLFGLCGSGFWYTVHRLDQVNDKIQILTSVTSAHIGVAMWVK